MNALELRGLHVGYGSFEVLRGVDLTVPDGSVVALLGANGAGKTTLLRAAAGLLAPSRGSIAFRGETITTVSGFARARGGICLVPEGRGIFDQLTVRENLALFAGGKKVAGAIEAAIAAFPVLGRRIDQRAGTMSGGEQQMLAVTRALITRPALVMADELSIGLAPVIIDAIFDAVQILRERGVALLIVEQYVDRILGVADYVYVLQKGAIAFVGEPAQCLDGGIFEQYLGGAA